MKNDCVIKNGYFVEAYHDLYGNSYRFGPFDINEAKAVKKDTDFNEVLDFCPDEVDIVKRNYVVVNNEVFVLEKVDKIFP